MESARILLRQSELFDELVRNGAPEGGDLTLASKPYATREGSPAVVIAFTAQVDGRPVLVQCVTTLKVLQTAVAAFTAAHENDTHLGGKG